MAASKGIGLTPPRTIDLEAVAKAWHEGRNRCLLAAGTEWWRVVRANSPAEALDYATTCFASRSLGRFTPIRSAANIVPAAYAGASDLTALWEVILRDIRHQRVSRVPTHAVDSRYLVNTRLTRDFTLLDLRKPNDLTLVAGRRRPPKLSGAGTANYVKTRQWAQALYDNIPGTDGLIYESHQVANSCIVLYQINDLIAFKTAGAAQPVDQDPIRGRLSAEAKKVGATIDFGDLADV